MSSGTHLSEQKKKKFKVRRERFLLCKQEELRLFWKLGGREAVATVSSGPKGGLALLVDEAFQQRFLVDTGSSYSIIPHKSKDPGLGIRSFQKNVLFFAFFSVLLKRTERSLRSFPFF